MLAVGATVLFGSSDTISKYLSGSLPIVEFIWIRYVLFLITAVCLVHRRSILPRNPGLQITRGLCVVGSSILFVYGVRQMTMAQATTISFLSPLLITILSIPLLGETLGPRRWAAVAVVCLACWLLSALAWAASNRRTVRRRERVLLGPGADHHPQDQQFRHPADHRPVVGRHRHRGLSLILPFQAIWPTPKQLGLSLVLGVLASGGQWVVILAHRIAPASLLAPFF